MLMTGCMAQNPEGNPTSNLPDMSKSTTTDGPVTNADGGAITMIDTTTPLIIAPDPLTSSTDSVVKVSGTGPAGGVVVISVDGGGTSITKLSGTQFCALVELQSPGATVYHVKALDANGNPVGEVKDFTTTFTGSAQASAAQTTSVDVTQNVVMWNYKDSTNELYYAFDKDKSTGVPNSDTGFSFYAQCGWTCLTHVVVSLAVELEPGQTVDHITILGTSNAPSDSGPFGTVSMYYSENLTMTGDADDASDQNGSMPPAVGVWQAMPDAKPTVNGSGSPSGITYSSDTTTFPTSNKVHYFGFSFDDLTQATISDVGVFVTKVVPGKPMTSGKGPTCP